MPFMFHLLHFIHSLGVLAGLIGVVFLLILAAKKLTPAQLKKWGIGLVLTAIALCALTLVVGVMGHRGTHMKRIKIYNREVDVSMGNNHSMHTMMEDMNAALEGKTGAEFDAAFLREMIVHHQGAIDMARLALTSSEHDEIRTLSRDIINLQQAEIDEMKRWQEAWGY